MCIVSMKLFKYSQIIEDQSIDNFDQSNSFSMLNDSKIRKSLLLNIDYEHVHIHNEFQNNEYLFC